MAPSYPLLSVEKRFGKELANHPDFYKKLTLKVVAQSAERVKKLKEEYGQEHVDHLLNSMPNRPLLFDHDTAAIGTISKSWQEGDEIHAELNFYPMVTSVPIAKSMKQIYDMLDNKELKGVSLGGFIENVDDHKKQMQILEVSVLDEPYDENSKIYYESRLSKLLSLDGSANELSNTHENMSEVVQPAAAASETPKAPKWKWPEFKKPEPKDFDNLYPEGFDKAKIDAIKEETLKKLLESNVEKNRRLEYMQKMQEYNAYETNRELLKKFEPFITDQHAANELHALVMTPERQSFLATLTEMLVANNTANAKAAELEKNTNNLNSQVKEYQTILSELNRQVQSTPTPYMNSQTALTDLLKRANSVDKTPTQPTTSAPANVPPVMQAGTGVAQNTVPTNATPEITLMGKNVNEKNKRKEIWEDIHKNFTQWNDSNKVPKTNDTKA